MFYKMPYKKLAPSRRQFLMAAAASSQLLSQDRAAVRPNVVMISVDGLAAWMIGCYGNKEIKTPNIDRFARTGMRFHNAFAYAPVALASRATLLSGRTPKQHGVIDSVPAAGSAFSKQSLLSDVLAGNGYACGHVGTWDLRDSPTPIHGYTYFCTTADAQPAYSDPAMLLNGKPVPEKGYLAQVISRRAAEFLNNQSAKKPFLLTIAYPNPYAPDSGYPKNFYDMYAGATFDSLGYRPAASNIARDQAMLSDTLANIRKFAAGVTAIDEELAALLSKLRERNLIDNTLLIFTSPYGSLTGQHGLWGQGQASDPVNFYDEVMRVPLLLSWSGRFPAEAMSPEMVSSIDIFPTICDAVGLPVTPANKIAGSSFLRLASRRSVRNTDWPNAVFGEFREAEMSRDNRYKLILRAQGAGASELFNLTADPREMINQYENPEYITVRERLLRELTNWRKRTA